jgi:hypothetical protein
LNQTALAEQTEKPRPLHTAHIVPLIDQPITARSTIQINFNSKQVAEQR